MLLTRRMFIAASAGAILLPGSAAADVTRFYWRHPHLNQVKRQNIRLQLELIGLPPHIAAVALPMIEREQGETQEIPPGFEFPVMTFLINGKIVVVRNVVAVTNEWPANFPRTVTVWVIEDRENLSQYKIFMPACGNLSVFIMKIATCVCPPGQSVCRVR